MFLEMQAAEHGVCIDVENGIGGLARIEGEQDGDQPSDDVGVAVADENEPRAGRDGLRERIGESLVTIRADQPLAHVTTGSLEALRKYTQALRLSDAGREDDAIPLLQEATTIDTSFAMAWRKLGVILANHAAPFAKVAEASERARRSHLELRAHQLP